MSRDDPVADALRLLVDSQRRRALEYLADGAPEAVSVEAIARHVCDESSAVDGDREAFRRMTVDLHHRHLPRLDEYGVVEFDADAGRVRYRPDELVESLLTLAAVEAEREEA